MAKLLVGQYVLLNELIENKENIIFLIVHYYEKYNPERTTNNLDYINEKLFEGQGIRYKIFHIDDFTHEINKYKRIEEFSKALKK